MACENTQACCARIVNTAATLGGDLRSLSPSSATRTQVADVQHMPGGSAHCKRTSLDEETHSQKTEPAA